MSESLISYLKNYGEPEEMQSSADAMTDPQLKSLELALSISISKSQSGSIVDVGCGEGVLLKHLSGISSFLENRSWLYYGSDLNQSVDKVWQLAYELRLHKRSEIVSLDDFYDKWPVEQDAPKPQIIVIRNVLHELDIKQTANLFHHIGSNATDNDELYIQDLVVFPRAERGNACWGSSYLKDLLKNLGWCVDAVEGPSKSGNRWFTLRATRSTPSKSKKKEVIHQVIKLRTKQWEAWKTIGALVEDDPKFREVYLAKLDFDLQFGALTEQLLHANASKVTPLTTDQEVVLAKETFKAQLYSIKDCLSEVVPIEPMKNFRNRARNQDALESFLSGSCSVAIIRGGPYSGKSVLAEFVAARRSYERRVIKIDIQSTTSVWNIVETYLRNVGASVDTGVLRRLRGFSFKDIEEPISTVISELSSKTLVIFDHFENLLDPKGLLFDSEIRRFIELLSEASDAKIIITTRYEVNDDIPRIESITDVDQPIVGRFPRGGEYVVNVLDDSINRSKHGIIEYPQSIFDAIDYHPYLAWLAAKVIDKEGSGVLNDESFVSQLKGKLRDTLIKRLVTPESKDAVDFCGMLRGPTPRHILVTMTTEFSVLSAENAGLIYEVPDASRNDLVTVIGALQNHPRASNSLNEFDIEGKADGDDEKKQNKISIAFAREYKKDHDPRWLRESIYHGVLSGNLKDVSYFGVDLKAELSWAGDYWFQSKRDYKASLWAYRTAIDLGVKEPKAHSRLAACLMRSAGDEKNKINEGIQKYKQLILTYPEWHGVKQSYVDSLISIGDYSSALKEISELGLDAKNDPWVAGQMGRIMFGQHNYLDAIDYFKIQLKESEEAPVYLSLGRCYHRSGNSPAEERILMQGIRKHKNDKSLLLAYASCLERSRGINATGESIKILTDLRSAYPYSGRVIFPLIKALCRVGDIEEADRIFSSCRGKVYPPELETSIEVELLSRKCHFDKAIERLGKVLSSDEHGVGMLKEIYFAWAENGNEESVRKDIACQGLNVPADSSLQYNVPLLVTTAKLAAAAEKNDLFKETISLIENISSDSTEIARLKEYAQKYSVAIEVEG